MSTKLREVRDGSPCTFAYFNFNETDRFNPSRVALTSYFPQVEETIQDGQMRGWRRQLMCGQQGTLFNYHFSDVIDNTGWPFHSCKTSRWLSSDSSGSWWAATVATYCPGRMAEHSNSKSTGGFAQVEWSPCSLTTNRFSAYKYCTSKWNSYPNYQNINFDFPPSAGGNTCGDWSEEKLKEISCTLGRLLTR